MMSYSLLPKQVTDGCSSSGLIDTFSVLSIDEGVEGPNLVFH